jgi:hypothetical protein
MRHRERPLADLRPELEQLLDAGLVRLYEKTDAAAGFRTLGREEALEAIANDRNWYAPDDLGEHDRRTTAYTVGITDNGREALRQESPDA